MWTEAAALGRGGASLLVYQHFTREPRDRFIRRIADELALRTNAAFVEAFRTPHVVFLLAAQEAHADVLSAAGAALSQTWAGQIDVVGLSSV